MEAYILKHNDFKIRMNSRSGGAFTAISDLILKREGVIYGVVLEDNIYARHIRAEDSKTRDLMRGSKYIQSSIQNCYKEVLQDLKNERWVLFSGTPCQIAGLKSFLGKNYERLITVDIVCYGVPSPKIWRDYISFLELTCKKRVIKVNFRNKYKFGWAAAKETITFDDGNQKDLGTFTNLFYSNKILRPSCYECPFKTLERNSDFTIGDAWGVDKANPEFNDNNGVSIILVNTERATSLFTSIKCADLKAVNIIDYIQPPFQYSHECPNNRKWFWKYYSSHSFGQVIAKYKNEVRLKKIKQMIKKRLHL